MKFEYPYRVMKDEARTRLHKLGEYLNRRHGIHVSWAGDTGTFRGRYMVVSIEGQLTLGDGVVHVSGKDPGVLWRKQASAYLRRKLDAYLDPARPLADLPTG